MTHEDNLRILVMLGMSKSAVGIQDPCISGAGSHRNEYDPHDGHAANDRSVAAQVEGTGLKSLPINEPHEDGDAICTA